MKVSHRMRKDIAYYHLPGLFEFYELYRYFVYIENIFMTGVR